MTLESEIILPRASARWKLPLHSVWAIWWFWMSFADLYSVSALRLEHCDEMVESASGLRVSTCLVVVMCASALRFERFFRFPVNPTAWWGMRCTGLAMNDISIGDWFHGSRLLAFWLASSLDEGWSGLHRSRCAHLSHRSCDRYGLIKCLRFAIPNGIITQCDINGFSGFLVRLFHFTVIWVSAQGIDISFCEWFDQTSFRLTFHTNI